MTPGRFVIGCIAVSGVIHATTAGVGFLMGRPQWENWAIMSVASFGVALVGSFLIHVFVPRDEDGGDDDEPPKNVSVMTVGR